jgi:hypothetical protein
MVEKLYRQKTRAVFHQSPTARLANVPGTLSFNVKSPVRIFLSGTDDALTARGIRHLPLEVS